MKPAAFPTFMHCEYKLEPFELNKDANEPKMCENGVKTLKGIPTECHMLEAESDELF